jgi:hypothetical protein
MTPRRVMIETTLYGKRLVTYAQLMKLHSEVSSAASRARLKDPEHVRRHEAGLAASGFARGNINEGF